MSELAQYAVLFGLTLGVLGFVLSLYALARAIGRIRPEPGKDVPATAGTLSRDPVWVRYHARYASYAPLFLAFTAGPTAVSGAPGKQALNLRDLIVRDRRRRRAREVFL